MVVVRVGVRGVGVWGPGRPAATQCESTAPDCCCCPLQNTIATAAGATNRAGAAAGAHTRGSFLHRTAAVLEPRGGAGAPGHPCSLRTATASGAAAARCAGWLGALAEGIDALGGVSAPAVGTQLTKLSCRTPPALLQMRPSLHIRSATSRAPQQRGRRPQRGRRHLRWQQRRWIMEITQSCETAERKLVVHRTNCLYL